MKKRKNYGRKIKKKKINLYPKKKTKAQKIIYTVLTLIVLLGIGFLGFCLGKPIIEYIEKNKGKSDEPVWTPPVQTTETAETLPDTTTAPSPESQPQTTVKEEMTVAAGNYYSAPVPSSALSNTASLAAFGAKASAEGYNAVTVQLKNNSGFIKYASEIELLQGTEAVTGTLSAKEIAFILKEKGLAPIAVVSVLSDNEGCIINPDISYKVIDEADMSWLDYTGEAPVRWANPESSATAEYNRAVVDELLASGFSEVILTNVVYPDFQEYDRHYISAKYFESDRYKHLNNVVFDGTAVEVNASDIISGQFTRTAEVLKNKSVLSDNKIIVRIERNAFSAEDGYPADASALLEDIMTRISLKTTGLKLSPMVMTADFTPEEVSAMKEKAEKMGFEDFYLS